MKKSFSFLVELIATLTILCITFASYFYINTIWNNNKINCYSAIESTYTSLFLACFMISMVYLFCGKYFTLQKITRLYGIQVIIYAIIIISMCITPLFGIPEINLFGIWLFVLVDVIIAIVFILLVAKAAAASELKKLLSWPNIIFAIEMIFAIFYLPIKITNANNFVANIPL